jgi:hypothetical protein
VLVLGNDFERSSDCVSYRTYRRNLSRTLVMADG